MHNADEIPPGGQLLPVESASLFNRRLAREAADEHAKYCESDLGIAVLAGASDPLRFQCGGCTNAECVAYDPFLQTLKACTRAEGNSAESIAMDGGPMDEPVETERNGAARGGSSIPEEEANDYREPPFPDDQPQEDERDEAGEAEPESEQAQSSGRRTREPGEEEDFYGNSRYSGPADDQVRRSIPVHAPEAEEAVIAALLIRPGSIDRVIDKLLPSAFYVPACQTIYSTAYNLRRRNNKAATVAALIHELRQSKKLDGIGGVEFLREINSRNAPTAEGIEANADLIIAQALKREAGVVGRRFAYDVENGTSALVAIGQLERQLAPIKTAAAGDVTEAFVVKQELEDMDWVELQTREEARGPKRWVVNGWLARGELSLWAGKVESGKTTTIRSGVLSVARGDNEKGFLGRRVEQTKVLYVMLDADGESGTFEEFKRLGMNAADRPWMRFVLIPCSQRSIVALRNWRKRSRSAVRVSSYSIRGRESQR